MIPNNRTLAEKAHMSSVKNISCFVAEVLLLNHLFKVAIYYPSTIGEGVERPGETYPLVVFCHGFGANYGVYTWLPEWMVPKGYVIAMIGLPDMLKFSIDLGVWQGAVTAAIDFALSENLRNNSAIYGMIDPTRVGAYGHSMGGATMFLATAHDRRIKATVSCSPPYFGTIWGEEVIGAARKVNVPMMVIVSNSDKITPPRGASTLYDAIDA